MGEMIGGKTDPQFRLMKATKKLGRCGDENGLQDPGREATHRHGTKTPRDFVEVKSIPNPTGSSSEGVTVFGLGGCCMWVTKR